MPYGVAMIGRLRWVLVASIFGTVGCTDTCEEVLERCYSCCGQEYDEDTPSTFEGTASNSCSFVFGALDEADGSEACDEWADADCEALRRKAMCR